MKKILIGLVLLLGACSDAPTAERVLSQNGYRDIKITGYAVFYCGRDDTYSTGFTATSPSGVPVKGAVCSGWGKGATIRFE
jgi:hypothetical protein